MSSIQVEASPQAGNFNWRKRLRQDSSGSESERKAPRYCWNIILESESPQPSEEDTESVYSLQAHETEYCKDTSDTDWSNYSVDAGDILMQVEYEVDSDYDKTEKFVFGDGGSSSGTEGVVEAAADLIAAAMCDSDLALWADTEDSKSGYSTDSELGRADYWTCVQCKNKNNNPLFRYCEKCYQVRKNFFPPRPKAKKKKGPSRKKAGLQQGTSTNAENESESQIVQQRGLSQDSGIATGLSQESIDLMDLGTIKIPENLLKHTLNMAKAGSSTNSAECNSVVSVDLVRTEQRVVLYKPEVKDFKTENSVLVETNVKDAIDTKPEPVDSSEDVETSEEGFRSVGTQVDLANKCNNCDGTNVDALCIMCMSQEKDAVFIHSGVLHMCCCYKCAMKVWTESKRCPLCNRKISNVRKLCVA